MNANSRKDNIALLLMTNKRCIDPMHTNNHQKQEDDIDSFEQVALPHMKLVYQVAYRLSGNREDAEDLTQNTFRIAFEKFDHLRDKKKCRSWLVIILKNMFFKEIKKKKHFPTINLDAVSFTLSDGKDYNYESIRNIVNEELQEVLDRLEKKYKIPLVLAYIDSFSYKEIASILNIPIGTVMSRIARGKIFLRKELSDKKNRSPFR